MTQEVPHLFKHTNPHEIYYLRDADGRTVAVIEQHGPHDWTVSVFGGDPSHTTSLERAQVIATTRWREITHGWLEAEREQDPPE